MGEITIRQAQVKKRPRRETKICCGAPRRQRGAPSLKCTTRITWSSARLKNEDHLLPKYGVNHFGMWCRRRESNETRLLILRNLLQTYERQNRTTRCMPAFYVQNHVQRNRALRRCSSTLRTPVFWRSHQTASHPQCVISALYGA